MIKKIFFMALCAALIVPVCAKTLLVDDDGSQPYSTIQSAIDDASAGDIVYVYPGTYREQITMKDGVNLLGYGPHVTTIDGRGLYSHVVTFDNDGSAVLSGFRITGSRSTGRLSWHYSGVYCARGSLTIRNNIIENNHAGIALLPEATPTIINNTITHNYNGIIVGANSSIPKAPVDVAYIYNTNLTSAQQFSSLLAANGLTTTIIQLAKVATTDFSDYRLIIVGPDTGSMGSWGTPEAVDNIGMGNNRPILGLGEGGSSLFQQMGLSANFGNSWINTQQTSLYVVSPTPSVYDKPYNISIPKSRILKLYSAPTLTLECYEPLLEPEVILWGRSPSDANHFSLVKEGPHVLWGFSGSPKIMTQTGKNLFINVVRKQITICFQLPVPKLVAVGTEIDPITGRLRYLLRIANWYEYPDQLFEPSPDLPPCGNNENSARTWLDIFDNNENQLYGYCSLGRAQDMFEFSVAAPVDGDISGIFVQLHDRRCNAIYSSNMVNPRRDSYYTHTIMNNIIVRNTIGLFYYRYMAAGRILYNDVWGNSGQNYHDNDTAGTFTPQPGTGEISADPLFEDENDYRLGDGSPCRDTGHPGAEYYDPDGTRNDMGAYGGPAGNAPGDHPGSGFVFTTIGNLPTNFIVQDDTDPSHGLAVVDGTSAAHLGIPAYRDAPFGGTLRIHGLFGDIDIANGVRYYQILIGPWDGPNNPPEPEDFQPLTGGLYKIKYTPQPDGTVLTELVHLGPQEISGIPNLYELTYSGWWSNIDLRIIWNTRNWPNGKYTLKYKAFRRNPLNPFLLIEYHPTPNDLDHITVLVDNTPVEAVIHNVKYDPANPNYNPINDGEIPECGIIGLDSNTENLRFTITAYQANGYLRKWVLDALWGKNKYAGVIASDSYPGVVPPNNWPGIIEQEFSSADAPSLQPWHRCAYQFRLRVWTRATNGYGYLGYTPYVATFNDHYFIDFGPTSCNIADLDNNGVVNLEDLAIFAQFWLETCD